MAKNLSGSSSSFHAYYRNTTSSTRARPEVNSVSTGRDGGS